MLRLNSDQIAARDFVLRRLKNGARRLELAGPAGSGKTTTIRSIIAECGGREFDEADPEAGGVAVLAPTNKAAAVLRSKGITRATTLHSATSKPVGAAEKTLLDLERRMAGLEAGTPARRVLETEYEALLRPSFVSRDTPYAHADLIILDEGSMVSVADAERLATLAVPTLIVGDPHQLQPTEGTCPFLTDLNDPDTFVLTKIERQAENSGILDLATRIREGQPIPTGKIDDTCSVVDLRSEVKRTQWQRAEAELIKRTEIGIVGTNRNRAAYNRKARLLKKGYDSSEAPQTDETFISYTTDRLRGLVKNDLVAVDDWHQEPGRPLRGKVRIPGAPAARINRLGMQSIYSGHFDEARSPTGMGFPAHRRRAEVARAIELDYAYGLTCHRMQGSEADSVLVIADGFVERMSAADRRRWLYTAVTRARRRCVLVLHSPWH